jgi:MFS family permease
VSFSLLNSRRVPEQLPIRLPFLVFYLATTPVQFLVSRKCLWVIFLLFLFIPLYLYSSPHQFWLQTFGYYDPTQGAYTISTPNESLVVSILSAGTFFGALLAAPMADHLGRRMGIIAACLVFCVGVAMQTAAVQIPLFVVGRVFAGLGVGMVSCLVPMYQAECSPKWIRGAVVSCYQWAIVRLSPLHSLHSN